MPHRFSLSLIAFASIALVGCGGATGTEGTAQLRAISAISSPSSIDVYTDVAAVGTSLAVGQASSFTSHPAQILGVTVRPAGSSNAILSGSLNLGVNQRYSLYPYQTGSSTYDLIALIHNAGTSAQGKFKLRCLHLDRFTANVNIYYAADGADLTQEVPIIQDLAFESNSGYVELDANLARVLTITLTGSTSPVGSAIPINVGAGNARTLLIFDDGDASAALYSD